MKFEQIQNLPWWQPNQHVANDLAHFGITSKPVIVNTAHRHTVSGDLIYNGRNEFVKRRAGFKTWEHDRDLNFTIDCPKHNIHIEDINFSNAIDPKAQHNLFVKEIRSGVCATRNRIWSCREGVYSDYFLSLRIMGYMIDCWCSDGLFEVGPNTITLAPCNYVTQPIIKQEPNFTPILDRDKKRYIDAEYHRGGSPFETIKFRYSVPYEAHLGKVIEYFEQHPRNFFLSCVRRRLTTLAHVRNARYDTQPGQPF